MASNQHTLSNTTENEETLLTGVNENVYEDQNIGADLTKKDINRVAWRSMLLQASFNYERMQASGWLYGLLPALKKIHTNKRDLARAMKGHMGFFNTHPFLVTFVIGIILAMERSKQDVNSIQSTKIAVGAPLGGIGDAMFWLTLLPILNHEQAAIRLHWLASLLVDAQKRQQGITLISNPDAWPRVNQLAAALPAARLQAIARDVSACREQLLSVVGINRELLLTERLLRWEHYLQPGAVLPVSHL